MAKTADETKTQRRRLKLTPPVTEAAPQPPRASDRLIAMMREAEGATAADLARAVGWQVHSVRGFIAGTLKKQSDLELVTTKLDGATRYRVVDRAGA